MKKYFKTNIIEDFRKQKGWSINKFCIECRIGAPVYKKILNQQLNFRLSALLKIARRINIHICNLCY